jgi:hypothetical protein
MPDGLVSPLAHKDVGVRLEADGYSQAIWIATVFERRYSHMRSEDRATGEVDPQLPADYFDGILFSSFNTRTRSVLLEVSGCLAIVRIRGRFAEATVAGCSDEAVESAVERIFSCLPEPESTEGTTPVSFWSELYDGVDITHRRLGPRSWSDIKEGYSELVAAQLARLMRLEDPPPGGKLILWHGAPGTGKTHALRALAHEWRNWCSLHLITDPERFVGSTMTYMMNVLVSPDPETGDDDRHKLIVLEDAGELLSADARQKVGPGLSRLLNLSDGLVGLESNAIILISTNEPLGRLHPAVHRPGRCLSEIEFTPLDVDEANTWLEREGCDRLVARPKSLAELYAIRDGLDEPGGGSRKRPVGFTLEGSS